MKKLKMRMEEKSKMSGDVDMKNIKENEENIENNNQNSMEEKIEDKVKEVENIPVEEKVEENENVPVEDKDAHDNVHNEETSSVPYNEPTSENMEETTEKKYEAPDYLKSEEEYEKFLNDNNNVENDPVIQHALSEFRYAKFMDDEGNYCDEMQEMMCKDVLEVLKLISSQGHSGFSIGYFKNLLNKLIDFEPLSPLTGNDDEWIESPFPVKFQMNARDGRVVRYPDGHCEFRDGIVIRYPDGGRKTKSVIIKSFPFIPKVEYIDYNEFEDNIY